MLGLHALNFFKQWIKRQNSFDEVAYLSLYPDVAAAVKSGKLKSGYRHYQKHGRHEGRLSKEVSSRASAILYGIDQHGLGLEIGPSHNPIAPKTRGYNVHVLDHASADELRAKYKDHGLNLGNIEDVDFIWNGQPLTELIGETECYDWIIASHVIEHVPDLILFLQQCEKLLKSGGVLSLAIPDKRYCFDYFQPLSTTGVLLDAYSGKRVRPTPGQVFDHFANASSSDGEIAWSSNHHGSNALIHTFDDAHLQLEKARDNNDYIDVHCWRFTPESFNLIISDLKRLGLLNLDVKIHSAPSGCEFYVSLKKESNPSGPDGDRLDILLKIINSK